LPEEIICFRKKREEAFDDDVRQPTMDNQTCKFIAFHNLLSPFSIVGIIPPSLFQDTLSLGVGVFCGE